MNYWHNYDKHNENFLSDRDQLAHSVILFAVIGTIIMNIIVVYENQKIN